MSAARIKLSPEASADLWVAAFFGVSAILPRHRYPSTADECVAELVENYRRRLVELGLL